MARLPSVDTLRNRLGLDLAQAKTLRYAMERNRGLAYANTVLKAHGVETINLPDGCENNCQTPDKVIRYVNRGDTYDITLMRVDGVYRVGSWGDEVERYQNAHGWPD